MSLDAENDNVYTLFGVFVAFEKDHKGHLQSEMGCHLSEVKPENRIEALNKSIPEITGGK